MAVNAYDDLLEQLPRSGPARRVQQNPYDAVMSDVLRERQTVLRQNVQAANDTTPDKRAEAMKLAEMTSLPVDVIERNLDEARRAMKLDRVPYPQILEQTPNLAEWLGQDANHAAVAADDMEQLGLLEWIVTAPGRAFQQAIDQDRVAQLRSKELLGTPLTREERDQLEASKFHMRNGGALGAGDSWFRQAVTGGSKLLVNIGRGGWEALKYGAVGAGEVGLIGGAGGSVIPGVGTGAGASAGALLGLRAGALYGAVKYGFELEAGLAFDEFLEFKDETGRPIDRDTARAAAIAAGALNAGLEAYGLGVLAKSIPGVDKLTGLAGRQAIKKALRSPTVRAALSDAAKLYGVTLTKETATEVAQRAVTILAGELGKVASGQDIEAKSPSEVGSELVAEAVGAAQAFGLTALPGPAMTAARGASQAKQASASQAFFQALGDGVVASKTMARAPQAVERLLEKAAERGAVPAVYAPAETWVEYWQSQGADPAAIAAEVTGRPDALEEALSTGADLRIPTSRYAVTLAGTEHNAFFANELRLDPDAMNAREEEAFRAEEEAKTTEQANQPPAEPTVLEQIRQELTERLVEGGKFDEQTAAQYATLAEQAIGTMAADAGIDPLALFRRRGLEFRRPEVDNAASGATSRTARGSGRADDAGQRAPADAERPQQAGGDAARPTRRRLPTSLELNEVDAVAPFARKSPDEDAARITPEVRRELERIADELSEFPFQPHTWVDVPDRSGNAAGGHMDIVPGSAGAPVYDDVLQFAPANKGKKAELADVNATRGKVLADIRKALASGRIHNNIVEGAVRVAERRAADDYRELSRPMLPPSWGEEASPELVKELSDAIDDALDNADTSFDPSEFEQSLFDDLKEALTVDTLETGEQQPRLPGAEDVREQDIQTPEMEVPFSLTSPVDKSKKGKQGGFSFDQPAYHGSPHIFERFSLHAIGTGEGAQAYGWGLYFAGSREVADYYRQATVAKSPELDAINLRLSELAEITFQDAIPGEWRSYKSEAGRRAADEYDELLEKRKALGRTYKVEIPDDDAYLLWDEPASKQSPKVQAALKALGIKWVERPVPTLAEAAKLLGEQIEKPEIPGWSSVSTTPRETLIEGYNLAVAGDQEGFEKWWHRNLTALGIPDRNPDGQAIYRDIQATHVLKRARETGQELSLLYGEGASLARLASETLAEHGVVGIKYLDGFSRGNGEGSYNFVIFDDRLVQIVDFDQPPAPADEDMDGADPELEQKGRRGNIRFEGNRAVVSLFAGADPSTVLHEFGHFFLTVLGDLDRELAAVDPATLTDGQKRLRANYAAALEAVGATDGKVGTEQQERFATLFEAYLREGKAPSEQLREVFARFRAWLLGVYRSLKDLIDNAHPAAQGVRLNDDVRQMFDRMLATDEAIAAAERRARMGEMFLTPEQAGMTPERFALYKDAISRAHRTATEALDAKLQAEVRREQESTWRARRSEVRAEVAATIHAQPVYQALAAIRRGTRPDGSPLEEGLDPVPMKLSRSIIKDRYGDGRLKRLPAFVVTRTDGFDPDTVAELFGFESGDELLETIATVPSMTAAIEQETDRRMIAEHGSLLLSGALSSAAQEATANEDREIVLRHELRALAQLSRTVAPFEKAAQKEGDERVAAAEAEGQARVEKERQKTADVRQQRNQAQEQLAIERANRRAGAAAIRNAVPPSGILREIAIERVARTRVRDLTPQVYWSAMRRASDLATAAAAKSDFTEAILQKRNELLSLHAYREAEKARLDIEARVKAAEALATTKTQQKIGKLGRTWLEQINGILDRYGFARVSPASLAGRAPITDWLEAMEGEGNPVEQLPDIIRNDQRRQAWKDLSYEELVGVTDGLKMLAHLARQRSRLLTAKEKANFDERRDQLVTSILEKNDAKALPVEFQQGDDRRRTIADWFASHTKLATIARIFDGHEDGGPFWDLFVRPLNEAQDAEATRKREAFSTMRKIVDRHYPGRQLARLKDKTVVPGVGSLSLEARIAVALNWGNETSRQRLLADPRRRWTRLQIEAILESLSDNDLDFVEETWRYIDTFWPEIAAKQERVTGLRPEKVEASAFTVRDRQMSGGYYPLVYDGRLNARTAQHELAQEGKTIQAGAYVRSTTRRGHVETRKRNVTLSVRLDLDVAFGHLEQVIHDLTHHEALIDVTRLLRDRQVQDAIYATRGDVVYQKLSRMMQDVAVGNVPARNMGDKAARFMRTGTQIALLGWNMWTALQQPLGLFNGMSRVGVPWVARGMKRWLRDAASFENTVGWITERSAFMRERHTNATQDVSELRTALRTPGGWFDNLVRTVTLDKLTQQHLLDSFLWHIGLAQRVADVPTWLGAYEKAMAGGENEDRAVALADQAVIDSQGSGRITDLSEVQRGGHLARLFLTFYTYGATVFNSTVDVVGKTSFKSPAQVTALLGHLSLLYFLPALGTIALANAVGRRDDEEPEEWAKAVAGESLSTALNTMIFLRELTALAESGESARGWGGPAGGRLIVTMYRAVGQLKQGEVDEALVKSLNAVAGVLFRYPAAQVERTVEGYLALEEGKTKNPAALLFGAPKE